LRTAAHPGWRQRVSTAFVTVAEQPRLWLYGSLGFMLRGGIILLMLPIVALPTQVEVRGMLGNNLGSTGFSDGFWGLVAVAAVLITVLATLAVLTLAGLELAAFERLVGYRGTSAARRQVFLRLFAVQLLSALALLTCAIPLAFAIGQVAYNEIVRPTSSASIYGRVLSGIGQPLYLFAAAVLIVEVVSALTTRELLVRNEHAGSTDRHARLWLLPAIAAVLMRPLRSPVRTLATAAAGWALTALALAPAVLAIGLAWQLVRGTFLESLSFADLGDDLGMILMAVGLAAAFALGLLLTGFASALRSALWSAERLR
jgi:hypothetical protein